MVEPADLAAVRVEPSEHAPQPLSGLGEELDCQAMVRPLPEPLPHQDVEREEVEREVERVLEQREDVEVAAVTAASYVPEDEEAKERGPAEEEEVLVCPPAESPVCEAASCPVPVSPEEPERPGAVITLEEEEDEEALGGGSQGGRAQKVSVPAERDTELPAIIELHSVSPGAPEPPSPAPEEAQQPQSETAPPDLDLVSPPPAPASACSPSQAAPHAAPVPCYWSLELLIAAAFCTDVPPFPLYPLSAPSAAPAPPNPHQGMELLSELADLELQQQKRTCGKTQGERLSVHKHTHTHTQLASQSLGHFFRQTPTPPPPGLACVALAFLSDAPLFLPV